MPDRDVVEDLDRRVLPRGARTGARDAGCRARLHPLLHLRAGLDEGGADRLQGSLAQLGAVIALRAGERGQVAAERITVERLGAIRNTRREMTDGAERHGLPCMNNRA
jgi:hypothetical protein